MTDSWRGGSPGSVVAEGCIEGRGPPADSCPCPRGTSSRQLLPGPQGSCFVGEGSKVLSVGTPQPSRVCPCVRSPPCWAEGNTEWREQLGTLQGPRD